MNEKEAIDHVKGLGTLKFKLLVDSTIYFETINPIALGGELKIVEVQFYIKNKGLPTVFCYHEFEHDTDFVDLQVAEINHIELKRNSKPVYFSQYKD